MKKTVLMNAAKKARIALAVMALCGMSFVGAQEAFAADVITDLPVKTDVCKNIICGDGVKVEGIDYNGLVSSSRNIVFGNEAKVEGWGYDGIVIGNNATIKKGQDNMAIGTNAEADGIQAIAFGARSKASLSSAALGTTSKATGDYSLAVGTYAEATAKYSVALGASSVTEEEFTVSLGGREVWLYDSSSGTTEKKIVRRRITNVADGTKDTDAATVGQVITNIQKNGNTLEFYTGKGADGSGTKKWEFDLAAGGGSTLTQEQFNDMLDANTKFTGLQTEVGNKANANGDNITTGAGSKWAENLGTGAIANGDKNLVNGETVYNKIGDTDKLTAADLGSNLSDAVLKVNTKAEAAQTTANSALDKAKANETKIGDLAKLDTAEKGNLVGAVNEVNKKADKNADDIKTVNGRVDELGGRVDTLGGAVSKLDTKVNKVGAGAAALAALHPMDFDSDNKLTFAAGVGNYRGANAAAIGAFYRPNEQVMFSIAGNMGNGENMVNAGVSFALDRPSQTPTTKAALVKTVAAQNEQIAALSETVAEQNEKIARLEAMVEKLAAKQNA